MAAKGTIAKENIAKKIAEAFGSDFVGEVDKKLYVWSQENGEKVQIAIAMTCPKVPVGDIPAGDSCEDYDFSGNTSVATTTSTFQPAEITDEEKANIADLMSKLGL